MDWAEAMAGAHASSAMKTEKKRRLLVIVKSCLAAPVRRGPSASQRFRNAPSHARAVDLVGLAVDLAGNALLHARAVHLLGSAAHGRGSRLSGADHHGD